MSKLHLIHKDLQNGMLLFIKTRSFENVARTQCDLSSGHYKHKLWLGECFGSFSYPRLLNCRDRFETKMNETRVNFVQNRSETLCVCVGGAPSRTTGLSNSIKVVRDFVSAPHINTHFGISIYDEFMVRDIMYPTHLEVEYY